MNLYSISALSEETRKDRRTLKRELRDVKPAGRKGESDLYELWQYIEALEKKGHEANGSLEEEQIRLTARRADLSEVELALKRGEVMTTETVERLLLNICYSIRRTVLTSSLPNAAQDSILADLKRAILATPKWREKEK